MPDETSTTAPPARLQPSASYSFTVRLHLPPRGEAFARVAQAIAAEAVGQAALASGVARRGHT